MSDSMTIGLIYGSVRQGRFCDTVVNWVLSELWAESGVRVTLIDPRVLRDQPETVDLVKRQIDEADAFIVVTPEYNHGYPGALKDLIDSCYEPWHAKPVGFVSYGGLSGGLRAVEQLRLVFAELHAVTMRDSVAFANAWSQFDAAGNPFKPDTARTSLFLMLRRLKWWANTLKNARDIRPYEQAA